MKSFITYCLIIFFSQTLFTSCTINRETIDKECHCQKMKAWRVPLNQNDVEHMNIQALKGLRYQFDQPYFSDEMSYDIEINSKILNTIQDSKEYQSSKNCDCATQNTSSIPIVNHSHDWPQERNRVSDIDVFLNHTYHR